MFLEVRIEVGPGAEPYTNRPLRTLGRRRRTRQIRRTAVPRRPAAEPLKPARGPTPKHSAATLHPRVMPRPRP